RLRAVAVLRGEMALTRDELEGEGLVLEIREQLVAGRSLGSTEAWQPLRSGALRLRAARVTGGNGTGGEGEGQERTDAKSPAVPWGRGLGFSAKLMAAGITRGMG